MDQIAGEVGELLSPVGEVTRSLRDIEVTRSLRDIPPAHYKFKIESFSILMETLIEKFESNYFKAGGYKWKLSFYPNGNQNRYVKDHISLYLVIADTNKLPHHWEVNVNFKLFVFDHIRDKYLVLEDAGQVRRFHEMKTEWGFDHFLSLDTFKNASNGYLVDDCCIFGAEIFVIKYAGKGECLSMKRAPYKNIWSWGFNNFSSLSQEYYFLESGVLEIREWKWKLQLHPKGDSKAKGQYLSLFLTLAEKLPSNWKLYAKYKLRVKDQLNSKHYEKEGYSCFGPSSKSWGFSSFMLLSNLKNLSKGFLMNDTIIVEVEVPALYVIKNFTQKKFLFFKKYE